MQDLLIKNGRLIDPAQNLDAPLDVSFANGKVAAVTAPGKNAQASETIDAQDLLVVPGLIDLHVHVFDAVSHYGIPPDPTCLERGVTTAVDAGSAGAAVWPGFRKFIIEASETRLYAMLNISRIGLVTGAELDPPVGELDDLRHLNVSAAVQCIEENRDKILGIKIRLSDNLAAGGDNEMPALLLAREAADATGLPIMIHSPRSTLGLPAILAEMRSGDILTHCFHAHESGILDSNMKVIPEVRAAIGRGVHLDVGHGKGSFSYDVARKTMDQEITPDTISTDLHRYNLAGPVFDMATTISKFLHLGMDLNDALSRVTSIPAATIKMKDELGTLKVGATADATILRLCEGKSKLEDTVGKVETIEQWLEPVYVVKGGRVVAQHN
ncbi:MAG: amidohydrolase/deacetylase family metallohydrolase [Candidatus Latescibacterota bacterium]|nr:amidohydrolase/deacetylase family metallohydrolase [Candidatus Latescibacterota bacterium]